MTVREGDGTERQAIVIPFTWAAVSVVVSVTVVLGGIFIAWGNMRTGLDTIKEQLNEFKNDTKPAISDIVRRVSTIEGQLKK